VGAVCVGAVCVVECVRAGAAEPTWVAGLEVEGLADAPGDEGLAGWVDPDAALAGVPAAEGLEAWADFSPSRLAFASDCATAPRAFSIARVRPATPGAEPWYGELGVGWAAGAAGWGTGVELPVAFVLELPRRATNHTAARSPIAASAIW
jgi:hypothetical protein